MRSSAAGRAGTPARKAAAGRTATTDAVLVWIHTVPARAGRCPAALPARWGDERVGRELNAIFNGFAGGLGAAETRHFGRWHAATDPCHWRDARRWVERECPPAL